MDAKTILLTANTETVYALGHLDLKADGPTVIEAPASTCSASYRTAFSVMSSTSVRSGRIRVRAENSWSCRPGTAASVPAGYFVSRSPTYSVEFAMRGFQVDNKTDQAIALMKQTKVYPLSKASAPPPMQFLNGSNQNIDTLFPDNFRYFELLAMLVEEEPAELFDPLERCADAGNRHREGQAVRPG